jgi:hypothetical protein
MKKLNGRSFVTGFRDLVIGSALVALAVAWGFMQYGDLRSIGLSPRESLDIVISAYSLAITLYLMIGFFKMTRKRVLSKLPLMNQRTPNPGP